MKVIHTFARGTESGTLPFHVMANAMISAKYAKEHYGRIELYADLPAYRSLMNCFGSSLPYDQIHLIETTETFIKTWSVPKLMVFAQQTEPYLHIDLDTVLYEKYDFVSNKIPFQFSHVDMAVPNSSTSFQDSINEMFVKGVRDDASVIGGLYQTYLQFLFKTIDYYPKDYFDYFDCLNIPNMNIIYVEQPDVMSKAANMALEVYNNYRKLFDSSSQSPCYVEQFLIHWFLRILSPEYKKQSDNQKHVIFPAEPLQIKFGDDTLEQYRYLNFDFKNKTSEEVYIEVKDSNDIYNFITNKFGGFFHSTGYKSNPFVEANILYAFREKLGSKMLNKLHRFHLMHRYNDKKEYLTQGQLIYEKYTNLDLFDIDVKEFELAEKNFNLKLF